MPYPFQLPDGSSMMVPDSISKDQAADDARKFYPEMFAPPKMTFGGALGKGIGSLLSQGQTLVSAPFTGASEAAEQGVRRQRGLAEKYGESTDWGRVSQAYKDEGVLPAAKELLKQSGLTLTENIPQLGVLAGGARAGAALAALAGPEAIPFGALAGAGVSAFLPRLAGGLEEQASEQRAENKPVDVNVARAAGYAVPRAGLDIAANILPFGAVMAGKMFGPTVGKLLEMGVQDEAEIAAQTLTRSALRGVGVNLAEQVPIQVAQAALGRANAGQDLTSPDAFKAYGEAAYMAGLMSPLGAIGGISERGHARLNQAEAESRKAAEEAKLVPGEEQESGQLTLAPGIFTTPERPQDLPERGVPEAGRYDENGEYIPLAATDTSRQGDLFSAEQRRFTREKGAPFERAPLPPIMVTPEGVALPPTNRIPNARSGIIPEALTERDMEYLARDVPRTTGMAEGVANQNAANRAPVRTMKEMRQRILDQEAAEADSKETEPSGQIPMPYSVLGTPEIDAGLPIPGTVSVEDPMAVAYRKAAKVIAEQGKSTIALIKEATGLKTEEIPPLLQQMERDGLVTAPDGANRRKPTQRILDFNAAVEEKGNVPDTGGIESGKLNKRGVPTSSDMPPPPGGSAGSEATGTRDTGLDDTGRGAGGSDVGTREVLPALKPGIETYNLKPTFTTPDRAVRPEVETLRQKAMEMYENNQIKGTRTPRLSPDEVFDNINTELKKGLPDLAKVRRLLGIKEEGAPEPTESKATKQKIMPTDVKAATAALIRMRAAKAEEIAKAEAEAKRKAEEETAARNKSAADWILSKNKKLPKETKPSVLEGESDDHPKWAKDHEPDVNGSIVYSDPEVALLREHNKLGDPIYMGVHKGTGNRTIDSIDSYKGNLFTPEQKQRLLEAKNRATANEEIKLKAAPDGPFKGKEGQVATSESIDPRYAAYLQTLLKSLGLGHLRVFLLHPVDLKGNRDTYNLNSVYNAAMTGGMSAGEDGSTRRFGPGVKDHYISIRPGMSEGLTIEAIAHEVGHIVQKEMFDNAPKETRAAVLAEHSAWLATTKGMSAKEQIMALRNRETAESHSRKFNENSKLDQEYWGDFKEWFADNVSRWATTDEKPVSIVEKFFKGIADKLRQLLQIVTGNRFLPAKSVVEFLNNMGKESDDLAETKDYVKTMLAKLKEGDKESKTTPVFKRVKTREELQQAVDKIKSMSNDERDNTPIGDFPGAATAYDLYEAQKLLPKPSDKLKKVGDDTNSLSNSHDYIANVDGEHFGISKFEDPDDENGYVYAFQHLNDPTYRTIQTLTNDKVELFQEMRKYLETPRPSNDKPQLSRGPTPEEIGPAPSASRIVESVGEPDRNLEELGKSQINYPEFSSTLKDKGINALSNIPTRLLDAINGVFSIHQLYQMYGDRLPVLGTIDRLINQRGAELRQRKQELSKNLKAFVKTIKTGNNGKEFSSMQLKNFYDVAIQSTLHQIEILSSRPEVKDAEGNITQRVRVADEGALKRRYDALPQPLKDIYIKLRHEYDKTSDEYVSRLTEGMNLTEAKKLRAGYESSRLRVYLPLFRRGDFWLSYKDKSGELFKSAFSSIREREQAMAQAKASGATDITPYRDIRQMRQNTPPPVGFLNDILESLKKQGIDDQNVFDEVYSTYLDHMPSQSLRQRFKTREGRLGMENDIIQTYANVGSSMQSLLNNIKHAKGIDDAMHQLMIEADTHKGDDKIASVVKNVTGQIEYLRNPRIDNWASKLGTFSYTWYLAGNASSAVINMTHLPMVVYPLLSGKYGWGETTAAMKRATAAFKIKGEDTTPEQYRDLFDYATKAGALGAHVGQELFDLRKISVEDYTGMKSRVTTGLNAAFQTADRANREITLMAAYDLALKDNKGDKISAYESAIRMVNDAYGSALAEAGPRILQNNFARVALTFKRFAMNRMFILGRVFHQTFADDPALSREKNQEIRAMARRQMAGIYGAAFAFAGVSGMPMVGATKFLMNQLMSDADRPYDADAEAKQAMGDLAWKGPINHFLNIDVADRTGWNGMLWKDDPKRLAEIGAFGYIAERAMGPTYSALVGTGTALSHFKEGNFERGFESMAPAAIRNILKMYRFAKNDSATTPQGLKIGDVNTYNALMQGLGFAPADIAEARAEAGAMKTEQKQILDRRNALLDQVYAATENGNMEATEEIYAAIDRFNERTDYADPITGKTIRTTIKDHQKKEMDAINGFAPNKRLRDLLEKDRGSSD